MSLLSGLHHEGESFLVNDMCKLHKSHYRSKQTSKQWFSNFSNTFLKEDFTKFATDNSLFIKGNGSSFMTLLVYVDDMVIASNNPCDIDGLKKAFDNWFKLKDLGTLKYFLGVEVARSLSGISLSQKHYALQLLS